MSERTVTASSCASSGQVGMRSIRLSRRLFIGSTIAQKRLQHKRDPLQPPPSHLLAAAGGCFRPRPGGHVSDVQKHCCHITGELVTIFPETRNIKSVFDYDS